MRTILSKDFIEKRKIFLSNEYIKVADNVDRLRDELKRAEDDLNDIAWEIANLDSLEV